MDALRCATTATLLSASLPALRSKDTPEFVAKNALALIEKELFRLEDLVVAQHHDRFVRSMAPKSGRELLFDSELLRAVGDHCDALRSATSLSQAAYVLY
jgi:hypothetical protein